MELINKVKKEKQDEEKYMIVPNRYGAMKNSWKLIPKQ
jgi:hypothetical protein